MCSIKKVAPRNFTKFTGKHLCQSLFFNKVAVFRPINSIIKQYCSCCIILLLMLMLIRIDTILSKSIQKKFQNLLFKKLLSQLGDQTDIFRNFTCLQTHFGYVKPWGECQVTPLRKPDDCFWIFHDFCHPLNKQRPSFFYFRTCFITAFEGDEYHEF